MQDWKTTMIQVPKSQPGGGYMRFKLGQNKFRILSSPVSGFVFWNEENKPTRLKEYPTAVPTTIRKDSKIKYFLAFCVWNFETKAVEILEITQSSIISAIQELVTSEEWGEPTGYSITVGRKGEGLETEYSVVPSPAKETPTDIIKAFKDKNIRLEALFDGSNPFAAPEVKSDATEDITTEVPW